MDKLIQVAVKELGQKEIQGAANNNRILRYAEESGIVGVSSDEVPWCSTFVNWVAFKAGLKRTNKANARSWLQVGINVDQHPEPGDVVIFWRESRQSWKGHVGFFFGFSKDGSRVYCLGGNQGNQVSISGYPSDTVLGFRRLSARRKLQFPDPPLKSGDTGDSVKHLQHALKTAGYQAGTTDGDFGPRTAGAVMDAQSDSGFLEIDGKYGPETRNYLMSILSQ
ncbi:MAG: TIGR02594 family protein [Bacteroidota bacterium]